MESVLKFLKEEEGISSVEYAMLLAFIAAGLIAAAGALGTAVSTTINNAATAIAP